MSGTSERILSDEEDNVEDNVIENGQTLTQEEDDVIENGQTLSTQEGAIRDEQRMPGISHTVDEFYMDQTRALALHEPTPQPAPRPTPVSSRRPSPTRVLIALVRDLIANPPAPIIEHCPKKSDLRAPSLDGSETMSDLEDFDD